ncbi:MAG: tetraacyldisaccharide 4'-kinase, partial [Synergistaceae bacterium]|nr:tetraacyldisaccharide 4'-kinase [Synergistaceae bacterium]
EVESWMELTNEGLREYLPEAGRPVPEGKLVSFSAIGNPQSFHGSLVSLGLDVVKNRAFRDHHRFTWKDIDDLERTVHKFNAAALVCTEKDLQNMPNNLSLLYPLYIPRISVAIDDESGFWRAVARCLKPELIVASNGYGEDSIGSLLADKLRDRFPMASVSAFSLVGEGREYKNRGIGVISPKSEMPSAGIVKYSLKALLKDFRHGLRKVIKKQIEVWRKQMGRFRTPICVGDVYLLAHTLWGQGKSPALVATAKSVKLKGHWMLERSLMKRRTRRVWTRDEETARNLSRSGIDAVFKGNPIMDLAVESRDEEDPWEGIPSPRVMLLPGSRPRAYQDAPMLLDAVKLISEEMTCGFVMVAAPTLDTRTLLSGSNYRFRGGILTVGSASVVVYKGPIAPIARRADLLIGLGGTANQVSAGLGVPVLSIFERGKLAQKKLLGDAEVLAEPNAPALAARAIELLRDPAALDKMSRAGIKTMGGSGALSDVVDYAADELGLDARCKLFAKLHDIWLNENSSNEQREVDTKEADLREEMRKWKMPERIASKMMKLVKIIK